MSSSPKLMKLLTTPSKVASALDWRKMNGSVLSLNIHKDRIGLAVASHPSYYYYFGDKKTCCCTSLPDIPLARHGSVTKECKERLATLAKDYRVCGIVVSWPLQPDTGRMGASCGRVLRTLDGLLEDSSLCTPSRPLCLWDSNHAVASLGAEEDSWGRSPAYSTTTTKTVHKASEEQYNQDEKVVASNVWHDFCLAHWPELFYQSKPAVVGNKYGNKDSPLHQPTLAVEETNWQDPSSNVNTALL